MGGGAVGLVGGSVEEGACGLLAGTGCDPRPWLLATIVCLLPPSALTLSPSLPPLPPSRAGSPSGVANFGYWGVYVQKEHSYTVTLYARVPEASVWCDGVMVWVDWWVGGLHSCCLLCPSRAALPRHPSYIVPAHCPQLLLTLRQGNGPRNITVSLMSEDYAAHRANLTFFGVSSSWQRFTGELISSATGESGGEVAVVVAVVWQAGGACGGYGKVLVLVVGGSGGGGVGGVGGSACGSVGPCFAEAGLLAGLREPRDCKPASLYICCAARLWLGCTCCLTPAPPTHSPTLPPPILKAASSTELAVLSDSPCPPPNPAQHKSTDSNARLAVLFDGPGSLQLDYVSLFPSENVEKGQGMLNPYPFRSDLLGALKDLKPA